MLEQRIQQQFFEGADLQYQTAEVLARPITEAVHAVVSALTAGGKLLLCGQGSGALLARHAASLLVGALERDRPPLAALALDPEPRTIQALGLPGDLLLLVDPSAGDLDASMAAVRAAQGKDMTVVLLVGILTLVAGWLSAWTFVESPDFSSPFQFLCRSSGAASDATSLWGGIDVASLDFAANVFVTITYGMVGWYLADHQARRYLTEGAWSLSGIALSGVFFTCAQMHFVNAVTPGDSLRLAVDLIGIPASVYFLWIVKQVHNDAVLDWNRRPLVGTAGTPHATGALPCAQAGLSAGDTAPAPAPARAARRARGR